MISDVLRLYDEVRMTHSKSKVQADSEWDRALRGLAEEKRILSNILHALGDAVTTSEGHHAKS